MSKPTIQGRSIHEPHDPHDPECRCRVCVEAEVAAELVIWQDGVVDAARTADPGGLAAAVEFVLGYIDWADHGMPLHHRDALLRALAQTADPGGLRALAANRQVPDANVIKGITVGELRTALTPEATAPRLPPEDWCDCNYEPIRGIKAGRHLPSCRYGVVIDYLDIVDPRADIAHSQHWQRRDAIDGGHSDR